MCLARAASTIPNNEQDGAFALRSECSYLCHSYLCHWWHLSNWWSDSGHYFWPQGAYLIFPTLADLSELNFWTFKSYGLSDFTSPSFPPKIHTLSYQLSTILWTPGPGSFKAPLCQVPMYQPGVAVCVSVDVNMTRHSSMCCLHSASLCVSSYKGRSILPLGTGHSSNPHGKNVDKFDAREMPPLPLS